MPSCVAGRPHSTESEVAGGTGSKIAVGEPKGDRDLQNHMGQEGARQDPSHEDLILPGDDSGPDKSQERGCSTTTHGPFEYQPTVQTDLQYSHLARGRYMPPLFWRMTSFGKCSAHLVRFPIILILLCVIAISTQVPYCLGGAHILTALQHLYREYCWNSRVLSESCVLQRNQA